MSVGDNTEEYHLRNLMVLIARVRTLHRSGRLLRVVHDSNNNDGERNGGDNDNSALEDDIRTVLLSYTPLYRWYLAASTAHDCDRSATARGG